MSGKLSFEEEIYQACLNNLITIFSLTKMIITTLNSGNTKKCILQSYMLTYGNETQLRKQGMNRSH